MKEGQAGEDQVIAYNRIDAIGVRSPVSTKISTIAFMIATIQFPPTEWRRLDGVYDQSD